MKTSITTLIVVAALSFSDAALAAEKMENEAQPAAETTAEPAPPAQAPQPAVKSPTPAKGKPRPKNLDLRHCLELKTDAEIAKCAGEL
jgi:hypothetical protein